MMKRVITFGEVMMRLSPPGYAKFSQATSLELAYGGGEANVAISLSYLGLRAAHVTCFPDNLIGRAATQFLRHHWLDTANVFYENGRMGKYFLEKGAVHRPSEVIYEREGSAFTSIQPYMINWEKAFNNADWFHWTGITPGISEGAAACCKEAVDTANRMGIPISCDINSRKNLWKYGKSMAEVMAPLVAECDVVLGSEFDIIDVFGLKVDSTEHNAFRSSAEKLTKAFPRIKKVFDKDRDMVSASHNRIQGKSWNGSDYFESMKLDVTHIVDRVGTGDAFAAGVIYGLLMYPGDDEKALKFATAACALKHTVEGDVNMVSADNVIDLMEGNTSGRIKR